MSARCWLCKSEELLKIKDSNVENLNSDGFAITNANYGVTSAIYKCTICGFMQCSDSHDVLSYYEELVDEEYESTREERMLQERKILDLVKNYKESGRLLDIGAGSGILIEAALERGYDAVGIEPSRWLREKALERGLPVKPGVFPSPEVKGKFDIITLVDVIEHVSDPMKLVGDISRALKDDGIFVMVTPDVNSFFAKVLGFKWWHYRVAHIGYFNKKTMRMLSDSANLKIVKLIRPKWYFSMSYLMERFHSYLPKFLRLPVPKFMDNMVIPLNLRDSWLGIYSKKNIVR